METFYKKEIVELIEKRTKRNVVAVFLSGSKLNNLNMENTLDTDYIAIVYDTKNDILHNRMYSTQIMADLSNGEKVDIKVYDMRKLLNLVEKSNFNLLEIFNKKPIITAKDPIGMELLRNNNVMEIGCWKVRKLILASKGFVDAKIHAYKRGKLITIKDFIQPVKFDRYIKETMQGQKWNVDFHNAKVFTSDDYENAETTLYELKCEDNPYKYQNDFITYFQKLSTKFETILETEMSDVVADCPVSHSKKLLNIVSEEIVEVMMK